ncbi:MAG: hypothetical protein KDD56_08570, partial [Bdellovibrionales bacterium]|nr:hypothetical protein [Bdellovibrionales bacterium]
MQTANLEIKRFLRDKKAVTKTLCKPGKITVLIDESGDGALHPYTNALSGKKTDDRFQFYLNGEMLSSQDITLVGFGDSLPDKLSLSEFLLESGYKEEELEQVIKEFDFNSSLYLKCNQLSSTVSRQLLLLKAFKSETTVLALNDPFLPFNGRWRADFAEKLLEHASLTNKILLIINLSFVPKPWEKNEQIGFIDVGKAAERARKKAEAKAALDSQVAAAAALVPDAEVKDTEKKQEKGVIDYVLPEHLAFAYREKVDWLFAPLANMSEGMRTYSGVGMPVAVAFFVVIMAVMMFPNIGHYQDKLKEIAGNWDYEEYKKIQEAESKKPKAKFTKEIKNNSSSQEISTESSDSKIADEGFDFEDSSYNFENSNTIKNKKA